MKIIILDDEKLAADRLQTLLELANPHIRLVATLDSLTTANSGDERIVPVLPHFKSRFLGRIGQRSFFVNATDIAMIAANNRIVHLVGMDRTKYLVDHTLDELQQELEPSAFFRINRSTIVHARAIEQVKPFLNHRLRLTLRSPLQMEEVIVSRDRVHDFKKWADF